MKPENFLALDAIDANVASTTSAAMPAEFVVCASAHVVATGTLVGVLKFQASNDVPRTGTPQNWVDISGLTVAVSAAGNFLIPKFDSSYQWLRVVYTKTSATPPATVTVRIKSIGI